MACMEVTGEAIIYWLAPLPWPCKCPIQPTYLTSLATEFVITQLQLLTLFFHVNFY
jgi:hypothetical protein